MPKSRKARNPKGTEIDANLGRRLRFRRDEVGLSRDSVAEHLGVTPLQIQKYENGTNRPSGGRLLQLATILDVPVVYFFGEQQPSGGASGKRTQTRASPKREI